MFRELSICLLLICAVRLTNCGPINATYDQRQNGKVNVHISIKDVAIILQSESGLGGGVEDDVNYDYDYDYDHLTVKPNGIWATLGASSLSPPSSSPSNPPPTPMISSTLAPELSNNNSSPAIYTTESDQVDDASVQPMETLSEASHPFPGNISSAVDSALATEEEVVPVVNSTTAKPSHVRPPHKYAWNGDLDEIPVEVIIEPVLKHKQRQHVIPGGTKARPTKRINRKQSKFGM